MLVSHNQQEAEATEALEQDLSADQHLGKEKTYPRPGCNLSHTHPYQDVFHHTLSNGTSLDPEECLCGACCSS